MIKIISTLERKYLELYEDKISLEEFETWIYNNQEIISSESDFAYYEKLIQIIFYSTEAKHGLAKALNIDFVKLELFQIQQLISNSFKNSDASLNKVKYNYELWYGCIYFDIGDLKFRMHDPFLGQKLLKTSNSQNIQKNKFEMERRFSNNFGDEHLFLKSILYSIPTDNFRVYNYKAHEQVDQMTDTKDMQTKKDEYMININQHICYINKNYINNQMKGAWL